MHRGQMAGLRDRLSQAESLDGRSVAVVLHGDAQVLTCVRETCVEALGTAIDR